MSAATMPRSPNTFGEPFPPSPLTATGVMLCAGLEMPCVAGVEVALRPSEGGGGRFRALQCVQLEA